MYSNNKNTIENVKNTQETVMRIWMDKKVGFEVKTKCHYSICWLHIIRGWVTKSKQQNKCSIPALYLRKRWEFYDRSCLAFFAGMSSECKFSDSINESAWYVSVHILKNARFIGEGAKVEIIL